MSIILACLPSLRPIYRLVFNGSLKSSQNSRQANYSLGSRNGASKIQKTNMFKGGYSESTKQLAATDSEGNKSSGEAFVYPHNPSTDINCESDHIALAQMHR